MTWLDGTMVTIGLAIVGACVHVARDLGAMRTTLAQMAIQQTETQAKLTELGSTVSKLELTAATGLASQERAQVALGDRLDRQDAWMVELNSRVRELESH